MVFGEEGLAMLKQGTYTCQTGIMHFLIKLVALTFVFWGVFLFVEMAVFKALGLV